ncbi:MAG TPA: MFS transporter, partial [Afipia sp.]|nr:MFS transporter [Afipia sp.]
MNKPVVLSEDTLAAPIVVDAPAAPAPVSSAPAYAIIGAISFSHLLNDLMQSLIPSVYPILKDNYALDFGQIGMITLAF